MSGCAQSAGALADSENLIFVSIKKVVFFNGVQSIDREFAEDDGVQGTVQPIG
ncbi:MAG: hypothetical protein ACERJ2_01345 [Filomicrobium sp.]